MPEQEGGTTKKQEETFGGNGYGSGIDYGDGFTGVQSSPNPLSCIH